MNHILIRNPTVQTKTFAAKGSRAAFDKRYQRAAIVMSGDEFPRPFNLMLGRDQPPYAAGTYLVDAASFTTNEYDDLALQRDIHLTPVDVAPKK